MWTTNPPTEPGSYWFYGDAVAGQMGVDFTDQYQCKPRLHFVRINRVSNGLIAVADGHFMQLRKFDPKQRHEGHIGYWLRADLPTLPDDTEGLFTP